MKITIATMTMVGLAGVALAQPAPAKTATPKPAPAKPAPAKPAPAKLDATAKAQLGAKAAPPASLEPLKPPAELAAMAKTAVGRYRCTGTETGPDGSTGKLAGTIVVKLDLDKWWLTEATTLKGARGNYKAVAHSTYDPTSKKWRRVSVDSMGNQMVGTSDGMVGTKLDWNMDMMSSMGPGMFRDHLEMVDKRTVKFSGELSMDKGKRWMPVYEMTCKK